MIDDAEVLLLTVAAEMLGVNAQHWLAGEELLEGLFAKDPRIRAHAYVSPRWLGSVLRRRIGVHEIPVVRARRGRRQVRLYSLHREDVVQALDRALATPCESL